MKKYVSIITPTYNAEKYVAKTLESALNQTFTDFELLVIDDCSSDKTIEIVREFAQRDTRVKLIQLEQNSGAAVARNTGIESAQGRYIAFLDSDDIWLPNKLKQQIAFMQENDVFFSYSAYEKRDEFGNYLLTMGVPLKVSYHSLLKKCEVGCSTAVYDSVKLGKVYMPNIRKRQDLGLWLRILKQIPYGYGLNEVLVQYTVRNDSISANKRSAVAYTWRLYREVEKLPLLPAVYYFSCYAINGVLRTHFPKVAKFLGVLK